MPDYAPAPSYPNYANFLSNLIGGIPTEYRNAQLQQGSVDVQNAFKGGVPTNQDGTPNYAAALQTLAQAGDPGAVAALGPVAQTQAWQQQAPGTMSPMLGGGTGTPAAPPPAAPMQLPSAPAQPPAAVPPQPQPGAPPPPTLAALVSSVAPDPAKGAAVTKMLANILGVDPTAPLTPDQVARAQRIMAAAKLEPSAPGQLSAPVRWDLMDTGQGAPTSSSPLPPPPTPAPSPRDQPTVPIATGNAPGTPFGLPPAAEAVWKQMVPAESGGQQFNADGSVVTSPAGALGIAQVEPGTGPSAARLAGLPWSLDRLKNDPDYNLALGRAYYAQQVQAFGAPDLAAAAYNAGPKAVLSAQAKASTRGGDWLSYLPAETRDYVAKVTGGGAQPAAAGGAPQGNRPIVPQVPLPQGITDPQQAILAIDREIAKASTSPNPYAKGQVPALQDWRDRIAASTAPMEVGPTTTIVDPRTGQTRFQGPYASGAGMLSPQSLDAAAEQYFQTGKLPPGMGRGVQGASTMNAVISRASDLHPDADWSERPQAWQTFQAGAAGQSLLAKRTASLELAENEASSLIPRVRDASKAVSRTQYPSLNTIIEAGLTGTGDPNIVKFGIAVESLAQTYARVLSPTGAPTAADKANAHEILSKYWGQGQIDAALDQMELEIASAKQSLEKTRGEMSGGGNRGGDQGASAAPAQSAPSGAASGQPVRVTKEQYDALPKGTPFIAVDDPTQTPRTKP